MSTIQLIPLSRIRTDVFTENQIDPDLLDGREWCGSVGEELAHKRLARLIPVGDGTYHIRVFLISGRGGVTATKKPERPHRIGLWLLGQGFDFRSAEWTTDGKIAHTTGFVYFIRTVGGPFVKIGWASSPAGRLDQLQTGCPYPLEIAVTIPAKPALERKLHRKFAHLLAREGGEWFSWNDEIESYISDYKTNG